jgi:hypothetical protein
VLLACDFLHFNGVSASGRGRLENACKLVIFKCDIDRSPLDFVLLICPAWRSFFAMRRTDTSTQGLQQQ